MATGSVPSASFLWHDYETWGIDPRRDRPSQFAAIRTTPELEEVGEPINIYCRPTDDFLPHPQAAMVTGITPQLTQQQGLSEFEFFRTINEAFMQPATCGVGYNTIRFDDEVSRFGLFRNFMDPYAREWQNGNSRWDIIDLLRMAHALRPQGIEWPQVDGRTSFRLEKLTAANGIEHTGAHDALADVRATIAMARLVKRTNPRLYDYYLELRKKMYAGRQLGLNKREIVLHVSGMYPGDNGHIAPVMPLIAHPKNKNEILVFDLRQSPQALLGMSASEIAENLYSKKEDLPDEVERLGIKSVHLNKSPALAPVSTLTPESAEKWRIDLDQSEKHRQVLLANQGWQTALTEMCKNSLPPVNEDEAEASLYQGFIGDNDKQLCNQLLKKRPEQMVSWSPCFDDKRLNSIYPRFLARNWPELLDQDALQRWQGYCEARLLDGVYGSTLTLAEFQHELETLAAQELSDAQRNILQKLAEWLHR